MGCNCNKNSTPPTGYGYDSQQAKLAADEERRAANMAEAERRDSQNNSYTLKKLDGSTQTFGSRLEAQAERVRAGGGSIS